MATHITTDCINCGACEPECPNEAISEGGQGTPFVLIMVGKDAVTLQGAQPYDSMRAAIDAVLSTIPGGNASSTAPAAH